MTVLLILFIIPAVLGLPLKFLLVEKGDTLADWWNEPVSSWALFIPVVNFFVLVFIITVVIMMYFLMLRDYICSFPVMQEIIESVRDFFTRLGKVRIR